MTKYLFRRLLHGILSVIAVIGLIMILIYVLMDRNLVFANDANYSKLNNNAKQAYKYRIWENYGYLDYVTYSDYLMEITAKGEISEAVRADAAKIGNKAENDTPTVAKYVKQFTEYYEGKGYHIMRLNAVVIGRVVADGGAAQLFAYKDTPILSRLFTYFTGIIQVDDLKFAENVEGKRGLTFTLHDPLYGGTKFSPAIIGNGTEHKYLLYFDSKFPYIHQNIITIHLGVSYSVNKGIDVYKNMTNSQGAYAMTEVTYPTGLVEQSADNLHSATYLEGSRDSIITKQIRFTDDYTVVDTYKMGKSRIGYSFVIGIIATILSYMLGVPIGVIMARRKDGLIDKIGSLYVIFIIAVPSLAYIFLFKAVGGKIGFPTTFIIERETKMMYFLPIISLSLPSIAGLMRWLRRYMIDQMNSDYVKFARSGGLTENEIFSKHILKNAAIPIIHGIPGSILGSLTGAIITERVYVVPGAGNLLTKAINAYDNGVIVGVALFYASLSIVSVILGDILMAMVDPRISYTTKSR